MSTQTLLFTPRTVWKYVKQVMISSEWKEAKALSIFLQAYMQPQSTGMEPTLSRNKSTRTQLFYLNE